MERPRKHGQEDWSLAHKNQRSEARFHFQKRAVCSLQTPRNDAEQHGNIARLEYPVDYLGNLCGHDPAVADKPLAFWPNPCAAECWVSLRSVYGVFRAFQ